MGHLLGGKVSLSEEREYGHGNIEVQHDSLIFKNTPNTFSVWNSHGDKLVKLPKGFKAIAETENSKYAGIQNEKRKFYGLQFHPEVEHSEFGKEIITRTYFLKSRLGIQLCIVSDEFKHIILFFIFLT